MQFSSSLLLLPLPQTIEQLIIDMIGFDHSETRLQMLRVSQKGN